MLNILFFDYEGHFFIIIIFFFFHEWKQLLSNRF